MVMDLEFFHSLNIYFYMKVLEDLYFLNNWIDLVDAWTDGMSETETHSVTLNDLKSFYMMGKLGLNI